MRVPRPVAKITGTTDGYVYIMCADGLQYINYTRRTPTVFTNGFVIELLWDSAGRALSVQNAHAKIKKINSLNSRVGIRFARAEIENYFASTTVLNTIH